MADTVFLDTVSEVVIVSVAQFEFGENHVGQVGVAVPVGQFIEQPMWRTIQGAASAIGIERGPPLTGHHAFGDVRIHLPMPLFVEHAVGRVALLLPPFQIVGEDRRRVVFVGDRGGLGVGAKIPLPVEDRPGNDSFPRQFQDVPRRSIERPHSAGRYNRRFTCRTPASRRASISVSV